MPDSRPIIIIKKKGGHGGHHGGAWKVAYADFVTAMMALFIVLWLLNTSKPVQEAVAGYFKDPSGTANKIGSNKVGAAEAFAMTKDDMPKLKEELEKAIRKVPDFDKIKDQIEMTITPEGLRIELLESETGTFFEVGSSAQVTMAKSCCRCWRRNWENSPTIFPSKATPIPSPMRAGASTGIGSFPRTAPTPPAD